MLAPTEASTSRVTVDLPLAFFEGKDRAAIKQQFDQLHQVLHPGRVGKHPGGLVAAHRALLPAALPQLVEQLQVLIGPVVALIMGQLLR